MKKVKIKHRVTWGFNPATRVVQSKKIYSRTKDKMVLRKNINF